MIRLSQRRGPGRPALFFFLVRLSLAAVAVALVPLPLAAQIKPTYLYTLSTFSGPLRYDGVRLHVDRERASRESPFGTTIAHGFLTLSLCVPMLYELLPPAGTAAVNYGVNRVRFPAAVPSGSRVRGRFRVVGVEEVPLGHRGTIEATVECEGVEKPVCVAELLVLTVS